MQMNRCFIYPARLGRTWLADAVAVAAVCSRPDILTPVIHRRIAISYCRPKLPLSHITRKPS